jgi:hypothetical protein
MLLAPSDAFSLLRLTASHLPMSRAPGPDWLLSDSPEQAASRNDEIMLMNTIRNINISAPSCKQESGCKLRMKQDGQNIHRKTKTTCVADQARAVQVVTFTFVN